MFDLEEAPQVKGSPANRSQQILTLSAITPSALEKQTENLLNFLKQNPLASLADVAYTLKIGRRAMKHRRSLVVSSVEEAVRELELLVNPGEQRARAHLAVARISVLFTSCFLVKDRSMCRWDGVVRT